jgi:hypothetical protein
MFNNCESTQHSGLASGPLQDEKQGESRPQKGTTVRNQPGNTSDRARPMSVKKLASLAVILLAGVAFLFLYIDGGRAQDQSATQVAAKKKVKSFDDQISANVDSMIEEGRQTFRFDTFGDEAFWGGMLRLHQAIEGSSFGGIGPGLTPTMALTLGLKVDVDALPKKLVKKLERGEVNLNDPAVTLDLLRLNAVVGVKGIFQGNSLTSVGLSCAICHSTVNNSLAPGIGSRLDGWANRDLNVGAIVALAPDLSPFASLLGVSQDTVRQVLNSWGPGKFDAELSLDGKAFNPQQISNGVVTGTNVPGATLIPPAFGLAGVNLHTWTGWGSVPHWNAFVANLEMHGKGRFFDPRLNNAVQFPIAATHGFADLPHISPDEDLITSKLPALHFYQLAIPSPKPPDGSFDEAAAERGDSLFEGKANCNSCHVEPIFTEPGWNMHTAAELCIDDFQANRAPDRRYRTSPLKGLWSRQKGGFFHDGRFATLLDVVNHYNTCFNLGLTAQEKNDLVQYLLSL